MEKLKVGMRIELVQVLKHGGYGIDCMTPGTIRPTLNTSKRPIMYQVLKNFKTWPLTKEPREFAVMGSNEVRPVGAIIITKVKSKQIKLTQDLPVNKHITLLT